MYVCMYVCMHVCMHACMHACMPCMHACIYIYMYMYMALCVNILPVPTVDCADAGHAGREVGGRDAVAADGPGLGLSCSPG